ncbi:MAG: 4Fe-4S binding protein [Anaerolineae bacterium]|nr:4Fe-4S binding protein [Anaerolineae bacterium]
MPACPYSVFTVGTLPESQRANLSFIGKLKGTAHQWQQALLVNPDACHACGLCVKICPEHAIKLTHV